MAGIQGMKCPRRPKPVATRFWAKVEKTDGCWLWRASLNGNGYGQFALTAVRLPNGKMPPGHMRIASRVAWELENGPIPAGMSVLHHCDNRRCVRPDHLFIGTQSDNMRDAFQKGRHSMDAARAQAIANRRRRAAERRNARPSKAVA